MGRYSVAGSIWVDVDVIDVDWQGSLARHVMVWKKVSFGFGMAALF